ncbi:MAG: FtsK/SpoIIIE domain-containing protein [Thermoguttaceae bacterium]|jgi:energy-coupling factor transporter ATP-binding protein EcfA2
MPAGIATDQRGAMGEPFAPDGPQGLLGDLCQLVARRVPAEVEILAAFEARNAAAEAANQAARKRLREEYDAQRKALETQYAAERGALVARFDTEGGAAQLAYENVLADIVDRFDTDQRTVQQTLDDAEREAVALYEAAKGGADVELKEIHAQLDARWQELEAIHRQAVELLDRWDQWRDFPTPDPPISVLLERDPRQRFLHALEQARTGLRVLTALKAPRFFQGLWPLLFFLSLWAVAAVPAGALLGWKDWPWVAASGTTALLLTFGASGWMYWNTCRRCTSAYLALRETLLQAGMDRPGAVEAAKADCQQLHAAIHIRHEAEMRVIRAQARSGMAELDGRKEHELQAAHQFYPPRLAEIAARREVAIRAVDDKYPRLLREHEERFQAEGQRQQQQYVETLRESDAQYARQWAEMADRWLGGLERFATAAAGVSATCDRLFPVWELPEWSHWSPPREIPPAIRFGRGEVRLANLQGGVPQDERLRPPQSEFDLPMLLPFPRHSLLMFKASEDGRARAVETIQAVMLRLLTAMPPGKVRFTICDPVGLGENFSAFMHLADYDEQLVASRIWTETAHIEQRLADLTQHMENVIQVYLRNEFQSILEYNASAGEMAEPYRVLVVANFPAGFSDIAAHRLKSIVASGARCGVFVLMSVDNKLPPPRYFRIADLESDALVLTWSQGRFQWKHPDYGPLAIDLEQPPPAEQFTELVRKAGQEAQDAGRVEVPFRCILPSQDQWWSADSRDGIEVPLGRAGAMKTQSLDLGQGTSQHVLISGKTGSGKSTLLHVLITNLAVRYSPDEIELYLVDFKKGVEFKAYARNALPHARVIAVESEREFGLSVLQRLDAELRTRGDRFRRMGVQDLKGFRAAEPHAVLPRILLIVDEFQELFVDDDRIAQEAALLLDRLVRQGRAFGIHVLLGSQTLGGAYSLARSTIGQMAVRIALQCSEADAHLILSEDNTAARLLTRPGEAIYNDANGLFEGNHPFQVVWLPDEERDGYLEQVHDLAVRRGYRGAPPIVFEGSAWADVGENAALEELLAAPAWPATCPTPQAWLGAAIAIKEPTAARFVRQAGSNLLLVGRREEAAMAIMTTCLVSLAAQHGPDQQGSGAQGTRFYVFDGTRPDAPEAGFLGRLSRAVPHAVKVAAPHAASELLAELAEEMGRRQQTAPALLPPLYVLFYNLGRFRDLRKEDDYGFGGDDGKPLSPSKQFTAILREGPGLGIHTLAWCDTYNTVNRLFDRQNLRDFEMRILFQMSATDSSSLMDMPDAGRLGVHRAIFYDEGQGRAEKFRPYGLPSAGWLERLAQRLQSRLIDRASLSP